MSAPGSIPLPDRRWPHFPHCQHCHRRLWIATERGRIRRGIVGPTEDDCCPHCGEGLWS